MQIVVLGAGRVGGAIIRDLANTPEHSLTVVDLDPLAMERLEGLDVTTELADLSNPDAVTEAVEDADLVVGCVPGFMGYRTVEVVL